VDFIGQLMHVFKGGLSLKNNLKKHSTVIIATKCTLVEYVDN